MFSFKRPLRIMIHAEFLVNTGFGNAAEAIVDRLFNVKTEWGTQKYAPVVMALGMGMNPFDNQNKKPYPVVPMYGNQQAAPFGHDYAADMIRRFRPDVVLTFGDTWMVDFWNEPGVIPTDLRKTFKLVGYVAIDGYPVPRFWIEKYKKFDKLITFTKFSKDSIDERAKQMAAEIDSAFIYHGVNTQVFKPLAKAEVDGFKQQNGWAGKKIIGMFSRNQPRKHHPEFVEFAAELLKKVNDSPDYMFYLHSLKNDAGWDLPQLIQDIDELGLRDKFKVHGKIGPAQESLEKSFTLKNRFIFPNIDNAAHGYPPELVNMMYNICDAHILLTSGEGFGMTVLESLSAGIPTFTNDYAASSELVVDSGGGEVIKARDYTYRGSDHNFIRPHTDYEDAVTKVLAAVNDPELAKKYKKKARAYALGMSWDIIVEDWDKELSKLFEVNLDKQIKTELV